MIKWEYKTVLGSLSDRQLNKAGIEGWELVAVESNENSLLRKYYFKRQIKEV
jgi:hypothetical protein